MQLYINVGDDYEQSLSISNITLQDGYIPSVGSKDGRFIDQMPILANKQGSSMKRSQKKSKKTQGTKKKFIDGVLLEPALWFKALVLDVIIIDCKTRTVRWSTSGISDDNEIVTALEAANASKTSESIRKLMRGMSVSLRSTGEIYDYEFDMDLLIDHSQSLVSACIFENAETESFHEAVLKLLHCYIFPLIPLCLDDLPKLEEILQQQDESLKKVEDAISAKTVNLEELYGEFNKECDYYIKELQDGHVTGKYSGAFARHLLEDIKSRLDHAKDRLNELQTEVDIAKSQKEDEHELQQKRKIRDQAVRVVEEIMKAREHLVHSSKTTETVRASRENSKNSIHACSMYMETKDNLQEMQRKLKKLLDQKVKIESVNEAIRWTIDEIKTCNVSYGWDMDGTGHRSTDVMESCHLPFDWKPINEQIYTMISDTETEIGKLHHGMLVRVNEQCQHAVLEDSLFPSSELKSEDSESSIKSEPHSVLVSEEDFVPDSFVILRKPNTNYFMVRLDTLKAEIKKHFECVCMKLQSLFGLEGNRAYKELSRMYEAHFFENALVSLQMLYHRAFKEQFEQFLKKYHEITIKDLCVEDKFIIDLLNDGCNTQKRQPFEFKPDVKSIFQHVFDCLEKIVIQQTLMGKLTWLTKCLRGVNDAISCIRSKESGPKQVSGCDELLPMLAVCLCNCNGELLTSVYVEVLLLEDLATSFLGNGLHSYSLVTFKAALSIIMETDPSQTVR